MKSKRLLKIHLTVFVLSVLLIFTESWGIQLHAQGISGHFSKSDRKDLDEASKEEVQAGELINEANSIYTEIYNSKSGQNDQKGKSKHLGNKALKKQLKAESLYESANATQYKIYKYHITKQKEESRLSPSVLNKVRLLEEQADQNYNRGQTLRQDGKKLKDDKLKYSKYTKANDYEKEALQEQLNILKIFFGDSATGTAISAPVAKPAGDETGSQSKKTLAKSDQKVVIDSVRVRAIQNKLKYISDAATFNIDSLNGLDKQSLSRAWFNYLYEADTSKYMEEANNKPQPATAERTGIAEKQQYESPLLTDKELVEKVPSHEKNEDDLSGMGQKEKNTKSLNNQSPISTQNYTNPDYSERQTVSDSTYRVQIAADRAPLSQETLRKIYSGNKNITMTQDGGWNKYSIGPFSSFEEAQKFKKSCGVKN
ncbi:MAG TPA: SPOR domain-containing protein, partial [Bacteroidales bacterium]|nr:SPOR domain-containing protein [Bacteroidales bacterium]